MFYDTLGAFWGPQGQPQRGPRAAKNGPGAAEGAETAQERPGGFNNFETAWGPKSLVFYRALSTEGPKSGGLAEVLGRKT